ncbi:MAG: DUF262 domain-containing protein [Salinibacter sp.]
MTIQELIFEINALDLVLPEFQREYVWTREQAKQLLVSLFKGYPTGSLLFWKTPTPPEIKNHPGLEDKVGNVKVILDGQQRLTALYLLTQNAVPPYYQEHEINYDPRSLHFNIYHGDFQYYQANIMAQDPEWVAVTDLFTQDSSINILQLATQVCEDGDAAMQRAEVYNANVNRLKGVLNHTYPIQLVPQDANIDAAIDVFDRVNSQGTSLSDAELALAHVTGKWPHARQEMKTKIQELAAKRFEFDLTFMVRALTGILTQRADFEKIHDVPKDELQSGWDRLSKILDYIVSILPGQGFIHSTEDLNTTNVLVPLVVFLDRQGGEFRNDRELRSSLHWLYAASMWARYTSQTDQRLDHDLTIIHRTDPPWSELINAIIDQRGRIEVKPSDFQGRAIQHPLYRMAYTVIKSQGAVDWSNGISLDDPVGQSNQIESHHIFPSSLLYSEQGGYSSENHIHKKLVNEIANRAFLSGKSNKSISNRPPEEYLPKVEENFPGALKKQFVPEDPTLWRLDRYEAFLEERRKLLAEAINSKMAELITDHEESQPVPVEQLIPMGESTALEFKSTLRWDLREAQVNKKLEKVIAKSVAGFLNAEGGTLLIGVADNGTVLGLEDDLASLGRSDLDGFQQKVLQVLENFIGSEFLQFVEPRYEQAQGKTVCAIEVDRSPQPIFIHDGDQTEFYVRTGNTTRPLDTQSAHDYISMHWD